MMDTIEVSRRTKIEYRTKPCSAVREGALTYEHGPNGGDEEPSNLSQEIMIDLIRMGFEHNPRYPRTISTTPRFRTNPIPIEEPETSSIADLSYQTLGRDEYDWTHDHPPPRNRAFARFEFLSSESSRGGMNHRRVTSLQTHSGYTNDYLH